MVEAEGMRGAGFAVVAGEALDEDGAVQGDVVRAPSRNALSTLRGLDFANVRKLRKHAIHYLRLYPLEASPPALLPMRSFLAGEGVQY